jgi:hypothetical protein
MEATIVCAHSNDLYGGEYQHIALLTEAQTDEDGLLTVENEELLNFYYKKVFRQIDFRSAILVSDSSFASVKTTHFLYRMLRKRTTSRCMILKKDFWSQRNLEVMLIEMTERTIFDDDLWVFVGPPKYLFNVAWALLSGTEYSIAESAEIFDKITPAELWVSTLMGKNLKWLRPCHYKS